MIGKNIGEGTFGKVKAGTHNVTGGKVSVQILNECTTEYEFDFQDLSKEDKLLILILMKKGAGQYVVFVYLPFIFKS